MGLFKFFSNKTKNFNSKSNDDLQSNLSTIKKSIDEKIVDSLNKEQKWAILELLSNLAKSDDELNAFILKFLRKQSRDEMISKTVNFQTIENILGSALIEYEENNDTSFKGYVELEQYHSATTRSFQLSQQVMFESILSGAK